MKTLTQQQTLKAMTFIGIMLFVFAVFIPVNAQNKGIASTEISQQTKTIKGIVLNDEGPLPGVDIILKGTRTGVVTDRKGAFTFPKSLSVDDILVFSYLGYKIKEVKIEKDTQFIELTLDEVAIEMIGALDTGKPYKSKRKN